MSYHTRNPIPPHELASGERKAETQYVKILEFFQEHPDLGFTPYEVRSTVNSRWSINGVRRAITDLTEDGKLVKTDERRMEEAGVTNCVWKLAVKVIIQEELFK